MVFFTNVCYKLSNGLVERPWSTWTAGQAPAFLEEKLNERTQRIY